MGGPVPCVLVCLGLCVCESRPKGKQWVTSGAAVSNSEWVGRWVGVGGEGVWSEGILSWKIKFVGGRT